MRFLAALLLAIPLAAAAQYEPGGPAGRGGYDEPRGGYGRRAPLYFAVGIGVPTGVFTAGGGTWTFSEWNYGATRPMTVGSFDLQVGFSLADRILLGFDGTILLARSDADGFTTAVWNQNADAVLTIFPQGEGFFVRGGGGLSWLTRVDTDAVIDETSSGVNAMFGFGWAFWLGRSVNLTLGADIWFQRYSGNVGEATGATTAAASAGLAWY
jgi:hypothetical protein